MKQIFVHGLGQTPASWDKTILALGGREPPVCPDLAGLVRGREASYDNLYQAFSRLCAGTGGSVDLCGLSLGAVLSLHYAIDHPERVRSLVLIAPQYKMPKGLLRFQNLLFRGMPKTMFQQTGFEKADFIRLCGSMIKLDFSHSLTEITCPVLIVCGKKDAANQKAAAALSDILGTSQLHVLEDSGHEVNVDAPEALAKLLRGFSPWNT